MMIEESESHGGEPGRGTGHGGSGSESPLRRSEGDLLAERRARRAAESGEVILTRRAEAAEATVETLERHVDTLQHRLLEAEEDLRRTGELLEIEKTAAREHELRRVKQREYAEQQLRVEAEDRLGGAERDSRAECERLSLRLSTSEQDAHNLAARLESLQRQLAESEHAAAAERAAVQRAEEDLQERLSDLESRANRMQEGLDAEQTARERSESMLQDMRDGHGRLEALVGDMKTIVERLSTAIAASAQAETLARRSGLTPAPTVTPPEGLAPPPVRSAPAAQVIAEASAAVQGGEMADALAAAVERLRARAEAAAVAESTPLRAPAVRPPHKHSLSLLKRWRIRRKQRRGR
jgi:chromosome segregation ATPase